MVEVYQTMRQQTLGHIHKGFINLAKLIYLFLEWPQRTSNPYSAENMSMLKNLSIAQKGLLN